jgi:hypothetical protein
VEAGKKVNEKKSSIMVPVQCRPRRADATNVARWSMLMVLLLLSCHWWFKCQRRDHDIASLVQNHQEGRNEEKPDSDESVISDENQHHEHHPLIHAVNYFRALLEATWTNHHVNVVEKKQQSNLNMDVSKAWVVDEDYYDEIVVEKKNLRQQQQQQQHGSNRLPVDHHYHSADEKQHQHERFVGRKLKKDKVSKKGGCKTSKDDSSRKLFFKKGGDYSYDDDDDDDDNDDPDDSEDSGFFSPTNGISCLDEEDVSGADDIEPTSSPTFTPRAETDQPTTFPEPTQQPTLLETQEPTDVTSRPSEIVTPRPSATLPVPRTP